MKQLLYKTLFVVCVIFSTSLFAQKKVLYRGEIEVKKAKTLKLEVKNIPLKIIESLDDKIYFDLSMEFNNHSEKEINSYKKRLKVAKEIVGNTIEVTIQSTRKISPIESKLSHGFELKIPKIELKNLKAKNRTRKTKNEVVSQIFTKELEEHSLGVVLLEAMKKDKKAQIREAHFILRVPKHLKFEIEAKESSLSVEGLKMNKATINVSNGNFQGFSMINTKLELKEGVLNLAEFEGGSIKLLNASKTLIGSIKKADIETESSKIEIGEIGENVNIKDFNSKLFLYNFSLDFKEFTLTGEYSKIHFYEPNNDFSITAFGNDTTFYFDEHTVVSQPSKENKRFKMMHRASKNNKPFSGNIKFDIMHSIFYYPTPKSTTK